MTYDDWKTETPEDEWERLNRLWKRKARREEDREPEPEGFSGEDAPED